MKHSLMNNNITPDDNKSVINFLKKNPRLTNGEMVKNFEKKWSKWLGVKYSVFVNSGSAANLASISYLRTLYNNGEVIVPTVTWVSDVTSVLYNNFKPVFVDINLENLAANENLIKRYLIKSPEQLKAEMKAQEERGEVAEEYVLNLELERLKKHPLRKEIKRTSLEDVKAGFDIQSFKSLESTRIDKFIEVKSFKERNERFFWSINEIKKSAKMKNDYILFIVNYSKINDKEYTCREIPNPYEVFKMEEYIKEIKDEKFKIEPQNFLISGII